MSTAGLFDPILTLFLQEGMMIFTVLLLVASIIVFIVSKKRKGLRIASFLVGLYCLIYLAMITTLILGFSSNRARTTQLELAEPSAYTVNEVEAIELIIQSASHNGATYRITNNGGQMIAYSHGYHLEAEKDGVWYRLKDNGMIVLSVRPGTAPGETDTYNCNWKDSYGSLPGGHYRLVKTFRFDGTFEPHYMAAEFTLN